ncbi:plectin-like isoform X6 [Durio zibethinus]|uniref:Plectin-like isoform X6 n=1 Tax=Durio zibethinus TaxID=66656 RepID=A0A6P5Y6I6_DURZI|nr:plectin-like isoform X6 [Durio zibethinus]
MASTAATLSPSSPQLRLALRCGNRVESRAVLVGARTRKLDCCRLRLLSVSRSRSKGVERRRNGASRIVADSTAGAGADTFSGWSDSDHVEDSVDSKRNGLFGGIMGAGSAGLVLVAGLSFATMSLSNRSTSRPKQQMEPLTAQEEVSISLASDNESDKVEENESEKALQVRPGKVLVPAVVDQVQGQALAALQVLKVIEADAQPSDLCTRREYARWLLSASSVLSRNTVSKVYPAMYIENVTELAFDDITPEDPDFSSIQGLAEAGLISSKLSNQDLLNDDLGPFYFSPESPLSRQDLVSWKMALEKRQLPEADRKILYQISGFIDIDKINPDAWPALVADLSAGEQGIIALAFGCTRLFQPNKPVTKAQAAVALATGEASDLVSEELARIEAESMAENAVSAHNALVAQVEKDVNASFEKELSMKREKIDAVEKMAQEAKQELERLRAEREEENIALMKDRAAIDSEMEVLSRLRREVEEQLESLMSNKVEISYEKERICKLRKETEDESQEIVRLQHELEVERKALSMARAWAEDEAKRARAEAKALEEARDRWEKHGIKVVVDNDLREESVAGVTWVNVEKQVEVEETISRSETLVRKLKALASEVKGRSGEFINEIVQRILYLILVLKEWASKAGAKAEELKDRAVSKARGSVQELQQSTTGFSSSLKEGAKRVAGDCREGVEKLTQRFRT